MGKISLSPGLSNFLGKYEPAGPKTPQTRLPLSQSEWNVDSVNNITFDQKNLKDKYVHSMDPGWVQFLRDLQAKDKDCFNRVENDYLSFLRDFV